MVASGPVKKITEAEAMLTEAIRSEQQSVQDYNRFALQCSEVADERRGRSSRTSSRTRSATRMASRSRATNPPLRRELPRAPVFRARRRAVEGVTFASQEDERVGSAEPARSMGLADSGSLPGSRSSRGRPVMRHRLVCHVTATRLPGARAADAPRSPLPSRSASRSRGRARTSARARGCPGSGLSAAGTAPAWKRSPALPGPGITAPAGAPSEAVEVQPRVPQPSRWS
jgi:hypothetical protein